LDPLKQGAGAITNPDNGDIDFLHRDAISLIPRQANQNLQAF
jgi:hypothetical protein